MKFALMIILGLAGFSASLSTALASGPSPASRETVEKALQALRPQSPGTVRVRDYIAVDTTETLQGTSPVLRLQEATTVLEKYENSSTYQLQIVYDRAEYRNGQVFYRSEQGRIVYQKDQPTIFQNIPNGYYSNLKIEEVQINVPEKVLKRKNCGGLEGCPAQVPGRKVSFDFEDQRGHESHYEAWGSNAVSFLATPMKFCGTTLAPYGDHQLSVTTCQEIKDFNTGHSLTE